MASDPLLAEGVRPDGTVSAAYALRTELLERRALNCERPTDEGEACPDLHRDTSDWCTPCVYDAAYDAAREWERGQAVERDRARRHARRRAEHAGEHAGQCIRAVVGGSRPDGRGHGPHTRGHIDGCRIAVRCGEGESG